jgi:hypothetical protein
MGVSVVDAENQGGADLTIGSMRWPGEDRPDRIRTAERRSLSMTEELELNSWIKRLKNIFGKVIN